MACLVVLKEAARAVWLTYEEGVGRVLASRLRARNATSTVVRPLIAERSRFGINCIIKPHGLALPAPPSLHLKCRSRHNESSHDNASCEEEEVRMRESGAGIATASNYRYENRYFVSRPTPTPIQPALIPMHARSILPAIVARLRSNMAGSGRGRCEERSVGRNDCARRLQLGCCLPLKPTENEDFCESSFELEAWEEKRRKSLCL